MECIANPSSSQRVSVRGKVTVNAWGIVRLFGSSPTDEACGRARRRTCRSVFSRREQWQCQEVETDTPVFVMFDTGVLRQARNVVFVATGILTLRGDGCQRLGLPGTCHGMLSSSHRQSDLCKVPQQLGSQQRLRRMM
jgi:hypothetical protein